MSWMIDEDMKIEMTKGDTPSFAFRAFLPEILLFLPLLLPP